MSDENVDDVEVKDSEPGGHTADNLDDFAGEEVDDSFLDEQEEED